MNLFVVAHLCDAYSLIGREPSKCKARRTFYVKCARKDNMQTASHADNKRGKAVVLSGATNVCRHIMPLYSKRAYFFTDGIRCPFSYTIKKISIHLRIYDCLR